MTIRRLCRLGVLVAAAALATAAGSAESPPAMHGVADAFVAPGVALAWGVVRGADESATIVAIRIVADPATFSSVTIVGSDPFTQRSRVVLPPASTAGIIDVRVPRAHFADFPRSDIWLHGASNGSAVGAPSLVVFYLGVPDTTPEFESEASLAAYLAERVARAQAKPGGAPR